MGVVDNIGSHSIVKASKTQSYGDQSVTPEGLKNLQFGPPESPRNVGEFLQRGVEHSIEMLTERLRIISQPLPKASDPQTAVRSLMIRESIDLATRECHDVTRFLSWNADVIASTTRTQNTRRRQIVPATPGCLRLKETAIQTAKALDGCCAEAWTRDDVSSDEMLPVLEKVFMSGHAEKFLDGRPSLLGANSGRVELGHLLYAMHRLESHWGSFEIWVRRPRLSTCESLIRAWQKGELDFEEFLVWFREHQLLLHGPQLDPYIAQVLLGLHVSGGEILQPGDLRNLAHLNDHEIYTAILRQARGRKLADEDGRQDRVRLTVVHDAAGKGIRRYAQSLDAEDEDGMTLKDRLPDITSDPIEFLCSSRQPIKLGDLAAMRNELAADERWSHLNLTLDEYRYVKLHRGHGMTQEEVREYLDWDASRIQAVRRNADLKLKKYRETGTADEQARN